MARPGFMTQWNVDFHPLIELFQTKHFVSFMIISTEGTLTADTPSIFGAFPNHHRFEQGVSSQTWWQWLCFFPKRQIVPKENNFRRHYGNVEWSLITSLDSDSIYSAATGCWWCRFFIEEREEGKMWVVWACSNRSLDNRRIFHFTREAKLWLDPTLTWIVHDETVPSLTQKQCCRIRSCTHARTVSYIIINPNVNLLHAVFFVFFLSSSRVMRALRQDRDSGTFTKVRVCAIGTAKTILGTIFFLVTKNLRPTFSSKFQVYCKR
jgi:hypothetical protein